MSDVSTYSPEVAERIVYTQCPICQNYTVRVIVRLIGDDMDSLTVPCACRANQPNHTQQAYDGHVARYLREGNIRG